MAEDIDRTSGKKSGMAGASATLQHAEDMHCTAMLRTGGATLDHITAAVRQPQIHTAYAYA